MSAYLSSSPDDKDDAMSELKKRDRDIEISAFLKKQAFVRRIRPTELSQQGIALQERLFTPKQRQSEEHASFVCPCYGLSLTHSRFSTTSSYQSP